MSFTIMPKQLFADERVVALQMLIFAAVGRNKQKLESTNWPAFFFAPRRLSFQNYCVSLQAITTNTIQLWHLQRQHNCPPHRLTSCHSWRISTPSRSSRSCRTSCSSSTARRPTVFCSSSSKSITLRSRRSTNGRTSTKEHHTTSNVEHVNPTYRFNLIKADPDDNKFVDCAVIAGATYIVSNDRHFRELQEYDFPKVNVWALTRWTAKSRGVSNRMRFIGSNYFLNCHQSRRTSPLASRMQR